MWFDILYTIKYLVMSKEIKEIAKIKNSIYQAIDVLYDKILDYEDDNISQSFENFKEVVTTLLEEEELQELQDIIEYHVESLEEEAG